MADAMLKAAQAAYDGNETYIAMLAEQLKAARERKKVLRDAVKREKAHLKEHLKAMKAGAVSAVKAVPAAVVKRYADTYQNRKLKRVGHVIPPRKKKKTSTSA